MEMVMNDRSLIRLNVVGDDDTQGVRVLVV